MPKNEPKKSSSVSKFFLFVLLGIVVFTVFKFVSFFSDFEKTDKEIKPNSAQTTQNTTSATTSQAVTTVPAQTNPPYSKNHSFADGNHFVQGENWPWELKLVNKWNEIDPSYSQPLKNYDSERQFDERALQNLKNFIAAGSVHSLFAASTYRTIEQQNYLHNKKVNHFLANGYSQKDAEEKAATIVAKPGQSEHNLGLAVDFTFSGYSSLVQEMETTQGYAWLTETCASFGFILRFPKGKEDITGVIFEPWHYRYVGEKAAVYIMNENISLEEYLEGIALGNIIIS